MATAQKHRLSLMTLGALAALVGMPALASPVLTASTIAQVPGTNATPPAGTGTTGYANSFSTDSNAAGSSTAYGFASQYGAYAVSSSAIGKASSAARSSLLYTLTNNSGVAQTYSMSFYIYSGIISTYMGRDAALEAGESLRAGYSARVTVGGTEKFSSAATLTRYVDNSNVERLQVAQSGTVLDGADTELDIGDGDYRWSGGSYSFEIGTVAAGDSIDILAEVSDSTFANVGTYDFSGGGGYGYGCYGGPLPGTTDAAQASALTTGAPNSLRYKGCARAFYGDPIEFGSSGPGTGENDVPTISFSSTPANGVPEPGSAALAGLALLGLGALRRRRRV